MKIVAGLGSIDEYIPYVKAGADEFFCGYVPYSWTEKYGTLLPLNRREVLCSNVQLGAFSELEILASMITKGLALQDIGTGKMQRLISSWLEGVRGEIDTFGKKRTAQ